MTVAPAFIFLREDDEPGHVAMARCAREALAAGPMGAELRGAWYESFLSPWGLAVDGKAGPRELRYVRTSCAVFASTCMLWAGLREREPWDGLGGWGIADWYDAKKQRHPGWLGLSMQHPAWRWAEETVLEVGDVVYRDYVRTTSPLGHVQLVVGEQDGLQLVAEGGGNLSGPDLGTLGKVQVKRTQGTVCRMSVKQVSARDSLGRRAIGAWKGALLG